MHILQMAYLWFRQHYKPPTELTEEMPAFQWISEVEAAFQTLKETLCTAPILAYPQPSEQFIVDTDASNVRIGGMLSEVQDGKE
jgi:cbb3-type cytochrome oxidase cytochrome c subunit